MQELSVLIPVYNEERSVQATLETIGKILSSAGITHELIAIDDGSVDRTPEILNSIPGITVITHRKNRGYGASLKTGIRHATYRTICITDADSTYPNERIPDLFQHYLKNKLDMVVGSRTGEDVTYSSLKRIPKFFILRLANYISNTRIPDINSGLRIFDRDIAMSFFHLYPNGFSFTITITLSMLCGGYEVDYLPINYFRREGKSKISPFRDTLNFFKILLKIALYYNPFKFFTPVILVMGIFSTGVLIRDIFFLHDLTQSGVFFPVITFLFFTLGLLADLIIKRSH